MIPKAQNRVVQGATYLSELVEPKHEFSFWCRTKSQYHYAHSSEKETPCPIHCGSVVRQESEAKVRLEYSPFPLCPNILAHSADLE